MALPSIMPSAQARAAALSAAQVPSDAAAAGMIFRSVGLPPHGGCRPLKIGISRQPSTDTALTQPRVSCGWEQVRRSEEHTSELQSLRHLVCRLLLEKKKKKTKQDKR